MATVIRFDSRDLDICRGAVLSRFEAYAFEERSSRRWDGGRIIGRIGEGRLYLSLDQPELRNKAGEGDRVSGGVKRLTERGGGLGAVALLCCGVLMLNLEDLAC